MAGCAGRRPASCRVIGIRGSRVIRLIAGVAVRRSPRKNVFDVAEIACHRRMRASQWEGRVVVVERRDSPVGGGVAGIARGRKARRGVSRIGGAVPIGLMAAIAGCR